MRPLLIDCDPGVDDALALAVAFAATDTLDLRAVTTVAGNVGVDTCTRNACLIREVCGRPEVPVHRGAERPLTVEPVHAAHVHGATGLDGMTLFDPAVGPAAPGAVEAILGHLRAAPAEGLTVVAIGPLTNIALALREDATAFRGLRELVVMGGARREGGNITPSAEFNMRADPHAAAEVYAAGLPIITFGLDATHQLRATPQRMARLAGIDHPMAQGVHGMLERVNLLYAEIYGASGTALHDPCTIAWLLEPTHFGMVDLNLAVETASPLTLGHTAVDLWRRSGRPVNTAWCTSVDHAPVFDLLCSHLERL